MITNNDISLINLSATKKDFYQIWNELLDTAKKLSERWDPTSTNESDPGIVLLKVLTATADMLNYNIDKNILEAFMPSAAQEESMRKLCEMLGYTPKYYQSAMTEVTFAYTGSEKALPPAGLVIPEFLTIMNSDKDVNYFVTDYGKIISNDTKTIKLTCIEGQLVQCESENDNIISMAQLDDNYRYYLPEIQVAENGIFIYNINDGVKSGTKWERTTNLNICQPESKVYKFGYDSKEGRPYLQFPEDVAQVMGDGLLIYYTRTSGINGNISARVLSTFDFPIDDAWQEYQLEDFTVFNESSTNNGANVETINDAYSNYNKTIGTFDTLVTCRDYMNKIYQLTNSINVPVVSNVIASDIRDDLNHAVTICTMDEYGIKYVNKAISDTANINNFDLLIYPFKTIYKRPTDTDYKESFSYNGVAFNQIVSQIEDVKTISHNLKLPTKGDIVCIKNYLKLNAKITTLNKVTSLEGGLIIANIKDAICNSFNLRNLDFGEEIPYDEILDVIQKADANIKNVILDEPILCTKFVDTDGNEYSYVSSGSDVSAEELNKGYKIYNYLAAKNILAGGLELFNYDKSFNTSLTEKQYGNYEALYNNIERIDTACKIKVSTNQTVRRNNPIKLYANEVIKFRAPNLTTTITYPAYVNYYLYLIKPNNSEYEPVAASFKQIGVVDTEPDGNGYLTNADWITFIKAMDNGGYVTGPVTFTTEGNFNTAKGYFGRIFTKNNNNFSIATTWSSGSTQYYYFELTDSNFIAVNNWIKSRPYITDEGGTATLSGIYRRLGQVGVDTPVGHLIDEAKLKYQLMTVSKNEGGQNWYKKIFIQNTAQGKVNAYGLGIDALITKIEKDTCYELKTNEYLCINYTSKNTENSTETIENRFYKAGDIICPSGFDLYDSETYFSNKGVRWSKTVGYDFSAYLDDELPGMYTLGPNEQIQIKETVKVELSDSNMNLYWKLNDEHKTTEDPDNPGHYLPVEFNLSEGEYIFYTDEYKTALAYYGNGTKIILHGNISLPILNDNISVAEILTDGIDAVPWRTFNLDSTDNFITIEEFQFVALTENDTLIDICIDEPASSDSWEINNKWQKCSDVKYQIGEDVSNLPKLEFQNNRISWEVRSILEFGLGPTVTQVIGPKKDNGKVDNTDVRDYFILTDSNSTTTPINANGANGPLCLQCSKLIQLAADSYKINVEKDDKLRVKVFAKATSNYVDGTPVSFDNLNRYWTSIPGAKLVAKSSGSVPAKGVEINSVVPKDHYGLLTICISDSSVTADPSQVKSDIYLEVETGSDVIQPTIFNNQNSQGNFEWWDNCAVPGTKNKYYLHNGVNVIQFKASSNVTKKIKFRFMLDENATVDNKNLYATISRLDLVNYSNSTNKYGLNLEVIDYKPADGTSTSYNSLGKLLLDNINTLDPNHDFYYNFVVDNSLLIDFRKDSKLSDSAVWYDYNNTNNKFVISEIDIDYIEDGIQIARISQR